LREALEDREYFGLLRQLVAKARERREEALERALVRRLN